MKKDNGIYILLTVCTLILAVTVWRAMGHGVTDWIKKINSIDERLEQIETRLNCIETNCVHMCKVDTLILDMSEYNAKNIEIMEENHTILGQRLNAAEAMIRRIDADLSAYD